MYLPTFNSAASLGRSKRTYYGKYEWPHDSPEITPSQLEGSFTADEADILDGVEDNGDSEVEELNEFDDVDSDEEDEGENSSDDL
jgi:hypothetical protein